MPLKTTSSSYNSVRLSTRVWDDPAIKELTHVYGPLAIAYWVRIITAASKERGTGKFTTTIPKFAESLGDGRRGNESSAEWEALRLNLWADLDEFGLIKLGGDIVHGKFTVSVVNFSKWNPPENPLDGSPPSGSPLSLKPHDPPITPKGFIDTPIDSVIKSWDKATGGDFKKTYKGAALKEIVSRIKARTDDGYTTDDFSVVIRYVAQEPWHVKNQQFSPGYMFRPRNFGKLLEKARRWDTSTIKKDSDDGYARLS